MRGWGARIRFNDNDATPGFGFSPRKPSGMELLANRQKIINRAKFSNVRVCACLTSYDYKPRWKKKLYNQDFFFLL